MATIRLKLSPGETEFQIVQETGAATNSDTVELTIDMATNLVNDKGTTRQIKKQEILDILDMFKNHIVKAATGFGS